MKERENCIERESDLEEGKLEVNQQKNRYGNILPCSLEILQLVYHVIINVSKQQMNRHE